MPAIQLAKDIYSVGVLNPNLRVFDIVMGTDYGTSYNAYLVRDEKTALVETCHHTYFDEFQENIESVCPLSEIDYIILNHTEPDHSGCLERLIGLCPKATIVASRAAALYLKNITNVPDLKVQAAADGDTLSLGRKKLQFVSAPLLHWPDSMFTFLPSEKTVFTCDFLGSHYCEPRMRDQFITHPAAYETAFKGYYDAIMGPFGKNVQAGLKKLEALEPELVCTSHGPVLTKEGRLGWAIEKYRQWSTPAVHEKKRVPIFYCSAYGYTRSMAEKAKEILLAKKPELQVDTYDMIQHPMDELAAKLNESDAFLIGTPTLNRDAVPPVWQLISLVDSININKKPVGVFGSYGWSGEGVPGVAARLKQMKFNVAGDGYRAIFKPSEQELDGLEQYIEEFVQMI